MSACAYLPARSEISFPAAAPLLSAGAQRHKSPFPRVRRLFPARSRPPGDPPALPEPRDPPGAARPPRPSPPAPLRQWESRLLVGRAPSRQWALPLLGLRAREAAPCRAGAARCLRGRRERREAGPGQPQPRQGTGRRGPFALAPSRLSSGERRGGGGAEEAEGRSQRRAGAAGREGGEEGAARSGGRADTGTGSFSPEGSGGRRVCPQNVAGCAENPSARRLPAVSGCGGRGVSGEAAAGAEPGALAGMGGGAEPRARGAASPALPCPGRSRCPSRAIPGCSGCRRRRKRPLGVGISIAPSAAAAPAALRLHLPLPPARAGTAGCAGPNAALGARVIVRRARRREGGFGMCVCGVGVWRGTSSRRAVVLFSSAGRGIYVSAFLGAAFDTKCHMPFCT